MRNKGFLLSNTPDKTLYDEYIYTDSNVLLDVFDVARPGHIASKQFLSNIYSSDNVLLVYSAHTLEEIKKVIRENISNTTYPKKGAFRNLNQSEKSIVSEMAQEEYEKILKIFNPVAEQADYNSLSIMDNSIKISKAFDNKVHDEDAKHLAVMRENGINSIATSDKELFNHTKGLNVYGSNKSIIHHQNTFNDNSLNSFETFNSLIEKF